MCGCICVCVCLVSLSMALSVCLCGSRAGVAAGRGVVSPLFYCLSCGCLWVSVGVCECAHGNAADWMPSQGLQEWTVIPNPLNASCPTGDAAVAVPSGTKSHPRKGKGGSNKVRVNSDVVVPPPPPLSPPTHLPLRPRPCFAPTMIASGVHVT